MKTAVSIPDSIFRSAVSFAKRHGLSRSELYANAIAEFLARRRSKQVTAKLDSIYEDIDSSLDSTVSGLQSRSVPDENW